MTIEEIDKLSPFRAKVIAANKKAKFSIIRNGKVYENFLIEYVRKGPKNQRRKAGAVVGFIDELGNINIGWSLCRKTDKFDPNKAFLISIERANSLSTQLTDITKEAVPNSLQNLIGDMCRRIFSLRIHRQFHNKLFTQTQPVEIAQQEV